MVNWGRDGARRQTLINSVKVHGNEVRQMRLACMGLLLCALFDHLGLQTSVFTRQAEINRSDDIFLGVSAEFRELPFAEAPNPSRLIMWATIGNSNDHVVIEDQTGQPWERNQQRFFIVTPDQALPRETWQRRSWQQASTRPEPRMPRC